MPTNQTHEDLSFPPGTIFFCLMEGESGMKSDRMTLMKEATSPMQYYGWVQRQRAEVEKQFTQQFVIISHSVTKP